MDRIGSIIAGIALVSLGIGVIIHPRFYDRFLQYQFDYTSFNLLFGTFMTIVGILLLWTNLKK
jgi:hypothetical protein